jgi:plastocyanin
MIQMILAALVATAAPAPASVTVSDFQYRPATLTVAAGQSVRFVNRDGEAHTISAADRSFDSGGLDSGDSWTHRFTRPGRYTYFCALHPYMRGTIVVVAHGERTP